MNILNSMQHMFNAISGDTFLGKIAISAGALIISYLSPITGLLITCFATSMVDMFYGIKLAKKQGRKITSKRNWKGTLVKIRDEWALIMLAHLIESTVFSNGMPFVLSGGVTVIITMTELWSIVENLNTLDPDGPWKAISRFLVKKGEEYTGIDLNKDGIIGDNKPSE